MSTEHGNYRLITVKVPVLAIAPNQKSLSNLLLYGSPKSLTRNEKFREMFSMEFYQKILYLHLSHTSQKFHSDHCLKHFCEFPNNISFSFLLQKTQTHTVCNNCPNIVDLQYCAKVMQRIIANISAKHRMDCRTLKR